MSSINGILGKGRAVLRRTKRNTRSRSGCLLMTAMDASLINEMSERGDTLTYSGVVSHGGSMLHGTFAVELKRVTIISKSIAYVHFSEPRSDDMILVFQHRAESF